MAQRTPEDDKLIAELFGRLNAQEVSLVHMWGFALNAFGYSPEQAQQLGEAIVRRMERSTFAPRADDAGPDMNYAVSQHMLDHLEQFWVKVAVQVAENG